MSASGVVQGDEVLPPVAAHVVRVGRADASVLVHPDGCGERPRRVLDELMDAGHAAAHRHRHVLPSIGVEVGHGNAGRRRTREVVRDGQREGAARELLPDVQLVLLVVEADDVRQPVSRDVPHIELVGILVADHRHRERDTVDVPSEKHGVRPDHQVVPAVAVDVRHHDLAGSGRPGHDERLGQCPVPLEEDVHARIRSGDDVEKSVAVDVADVDVRNPEVLRRREHFGRGERPVAQLAVEDHLVVVRVLVRLTLGRDDDVGQTVARYVTDGGSLGRRAEHMALCGSERKRVGAGARRAGDRKRGCQRGERYLETATRP